MSPLTTSNAFSFSSIVYGLTAYFSFEKEGTSAVLSDSSSLEVALRRAVGPLLLLHELLAGNSECRRVAFLDVDKGKVSLSLLGNK